MRREYGELDAVWFLAGSLFKVSPAPWAPSDPVPRFMQEQKKQKKQKKQHTSY